MKSFLRLMVVVMVLVPAAFVVAQSTSTEIKSGGVVAVYGHTLVAKMPTGEVKEFDVPADFRFNVDGQMLSVSELKPGTELTAVVNTTKTPEVVRTVRLKNAEVVKVVAAELFVKQDGQVKSYTVPAGFTFLVDGKQVGVVQLSPGTKLNAEIVYKSERIVTEKDIRVGGTAPSVPAAAPAPPAEPPAAAAAETSPEMPKTASTIPTIGIIGFLMLVSGLLVPRYFRRLEPRRCWS